MGLKFMALKLNLWNWVALFGIVLIICYIVINYTQEGKDFYEATIKNLQFMVICILVAACIYFYLMYSKKAVWAKAWEVLQASCENYKGGLAVYGMRYKQIMAKKPFLHRIEPHIAYIYIGEFFENGKKASIMLNAMHPPLGDVMHTWNYAISKKEIDILNKQGITLEEAVSKVAEVKKASESVEEEKVW